MDEREAVIDRARHVISRVEAAEIAAGHPRGSVRLVAVSKRKPAEAIIAAWEAGISEFGENYVQEALQKAGSIPEGARLHLVGNLQRNKARKAAALFDMVQSVDSPEIAEALDRAAHEAGRRMEVLLEVNVGMEQGKAGVGADGLLSLADRVAGLPNLSLRGLMFIPPAECTEAFFPEAKDLFDAACARLGGDSGFDILSMGMSQDFERAILCGSTMVRIGRAIFGER